MKALLLALAFFLIFSIVPVRAAVQSSTSSAQQTATVSAVATPSAVINRELQDTIQKDITQTNSQVKSKLASYLDEHPKQPLSPFNVIQHAIRNSVNQGVPANILVLLLLFPVVASLIAIFRHIIGLRGFGIYTPAVLAVAFLSTGITVGLILFTAVFLATALGKFLINRLRIQYLPRTSILLWMVSLAIFGLFLAAPYLSLTNSIVSISIFPILMLVLLSENFMEAQLSSNFKKAMTLTIETLLLALVSTLLMRTLEVQQFVILHPEVTLLGVLVIDILVGRYTGLRISEFFRFKQVIDSEE